MNLDALSDDEIDALLGDGIEPAEVPLPRARHHNAGALIQMAVDKRAVLREWLCERKRNAPAADLPQRELWEASPVPVADTANHICCLINVRGVMNPRACEAALQRVVDRQEVLRLSFLPGKGQPLQMIRRSGEQNLQFRELEGVGAFGRGGGGNRGGGFPHTVRLGAGAALPSQLLRAERGRHTCWRSPFTMRSPTAGRWGCSSKICASPMSRRSWVCATRSRRCR